MEIKKKIKKTIKGTIENFVLYKTGTADSGKDWALYEGFISGEKFKTFDDSYVRNKGLVGEFTFEEEDKTFVNKEGETIEYTSRTLFPLKTAKKSEKIITENEIPTIEEKEEPTIEEKEINIEEKPKDEIQKALKQSDDPWIKKLYNNQITMLTELEEISKKLDIEE